MDFFYIMHVLKRIYNVTNICLYFFWVCYLEAIQKIQTIHINIKEKSFWHGKMHRLSTIKH